MRLDDIIGDVIYISFRDLKRMQEIGISETSGHYMLKGYDQLGLWLEHPGIIIHHMEDEEGRPIQPDKQIEEEIDAVFLLQWDNVNNIMHYPDRKGFDLPDQYRKKIGFRFKEKHESTRND